MPNQYKNQQNIQFASVVILNMAADVVFDYFIPEHLRGSIFPGSRVKVPFGAKNEERTAFVVDLLAKSNYNSQKVKSIIALENSKEQIPPNLLKLARWMADYYCAPYDKAMMTLLPAVVRNGKVKQKEEKYVVLNPEINVQEEATKIVKRSPKGADVLHNLERMGKMPLQQLCSFLSITDAVVKGLEKKGLVTFEKIAIESELEEDLELIRTKPLPLSDDQKKIMPELLTAIAAREGGTYLLHGVTGSGKTEVYLQAIAKCLEQGQQAIVLVPEISLTPQTTQRFRSRFGDQVSVLHSSLSNSKRFSEWQRLQQGKATIAVGARSALFAPLSNIGLIVVDEEHEGCYKQDEAPRYNARDVAVVRGKFDKAVVLLGSATPSFESYNNSQNGKYKLLSLPNRIDDRSMPYVELVDMRADSNQGIFSRRLEAAVHSRLSAGEQVILFLNRRGYATQFLCKVCGYIAKCPECDQAYTYHRKFNQMCCHSCGQVVAVSEECPLCGSAEVKFSGVGTEKVENVAKALFNNARIVRMDTDTTAAKDSHEKLLNDFRSGKANLLIGTQMIAKGHHFPNVTLVGVINSDKGLHIPDFRASERTFSLLTQVAGRAGRGNRAGEVIVQGYNIDHPALQYAKRHDYCGFYKEEISIRELLDLPPFSHMVVVRFQGSNEEKVKEIAEKFAEKANELLPANLRKSLPAPCTIPKNRSYFRYQIVYRGAGILKWGQTLRQLVANNNFTRTVKINIDVDPQNLL